MLCVNEVEACALAGTETFEADAVLTLLHEKYPQTRLLLTAGSAGSYYLDAERRLFVQFYSKKVWRQFFSEVGVA